MPRILTADPALPYARPPLSKDYLRGETEDVALHPAQWYDDRSIELVNDLRVDRIDGQSRTVIAGDISLRISRPWCWPAAQHPPHLRCPEASQRCGYAR